MQQNLVPGNEASNLWVPELIFSNTDENMLITNDEKAVLQIERKGAKIPEGDVLSINQVLQYKGSENPLVFTRDFVQDFNCYFDLGAFPFDTQVCSCYQFNRKGYFKCLFQ